MSSSSEWDALIQAVEEPDVPEHEHTPLFFLDTTIGICSGCRVKMVRE